MRKNSVFIMIIAASALILGAITVLLFRPAPKVAYINNAEVYNEFVLKKELESKLNSTRNTRKAVLDSMMLSLQVHSRKLEADKVKMNDPGVQQFEVAKQEFMAKEQQFSEDNERMAQQYTEQIWKQINQYVQDYAKANGYTFVLGAVGDGALMYGEEQHNITKEVTEYINTKYNGSSK
jgi:outer membrane protein